MRIRFPASAQSEQRASILQRASLAQPADRVANSWPDRKRKEWYRNGGRFAPRHQQFGLQTIDTPYQKMRTAPPIGGATRIGEPYYRHTASGPTPRHRRGMPINGGGAIRTGGGAASTISGAGPSSR